MSSSLRVRFKAYDSSGAFLGFLRPSSWSASVQHNDAGTLSMTYPRTALGGGILKRGLEQGLEIGMEVASHDGAWVEPYNCRFLLVSRSRDAKDATDTVTLNCMTWIWLAKKILNLNMGALLTDTDNKGKRPFYSANPGMIVHTLLDENRDRGGAATVMPAGFNSSRDTNGDAWAYKMTLYYDPGVDLYTVIDNLSANGLCDWRTDGRMLKLWNADSTALCRDLSGRVRIQLATGLLESPEEETIEGLAGNILIKGDNDLIFTQENKAAPTPWGKWELYSSQGGVSNKDTARLMMQTQLASAARVRGQYTRQILTDDIDYLPLVDYRPGDWITAPTVTHGEKVRVQRVELSNRNDGGVKCALMLNDRLYDAQTRQAKRIQGITGGAVAGGASGATPAPEKDHRVPMAPAGLVVQTDAYLDATGYARGLSTAHWAAVTQATNRTSIEITSYWVEWRPNIAGEGWRSAGVTTDTTLSWGNLDCGTAIQVRVRAVPTYSDKLGEWCQPVMVDVAQDVTPPSVPSVPVLSSETGIVTIQWDGKTSTGALMDADFDHVEVGRGTGSTNINVIAATQSGAGDYLDTTLADGDIRYYALRAVDHAGNRSAWSTPAQITCQGAVSSADLDQITQTITANKQILDKTNEDLDKTKTDLSQAKTDISANASALATANSELSSVKTDLAQAKTDIANAAKEAGNAVSAAESAAQQAGAASSTAMSAASAAASAVTVANNAASSAAASAAQTVISSIVEYAVNNSRSTPPSEVRTWWEGTPNNSVSVLAMCWSTDTPTVGAGEYAWIRTRITHSDGSVEYSTPAVITGEQGPQGDKGEDGVQRYAYFAYATSAAGANFSKTPTAASTYIGVCVTTNVTQPTDPKQYTWSLTKGNTGDRGPQGAAGAKGDVGEDGKTYYTYFAYGTSSTGADFSTTPTSSSTYMGVCITLDSSQPTDPARYTWSLTKGNTGDRGPQGAPGKDGQAGAAGVSVTAITPWYALALSKPAAPTVKDPGSPWSTNEPEYDKQKNLYTTSRIDYSNGQYSWTPVQMSSAYKATQAAETAARDAITTATNAATTADTAKKTADASKSESADAKSIATGANATATQANATAASAQQAATSAQTAANILMQQAADLQPNSGFERGTDYWRTDVSGAAFVETSQYAHSGVRRAYLNRGLRTSELVGTQTVNAVTGRRYRLGIWIKLINPGDATSGGLRLQYSTDGVNWADTTATLDILTTNGDAWTYASVDYVATESTPLLRARIAYDKPVDAYIDDFRLQDITEAYAAQQTADEAQATAAQAKIDAANADAKAVSAAAAAAGAQTTADSKSTVYTQPNEPAHGTLTPGDVWRRTSTADPDTHWLGTPNDSVSVLNVHTDEIEETLVWNGSRFTPYYMYLDSLAVTGSISTDLLAADSVTADKIRALSITADKIAANAVNADKLDANSVTADKIAANAITADKIKALAVTTDKIAANAVNADKIAANAITAEKIAALAITADKIAAATITSDKIKAGQFVGYVFTGAVFQSHTEANKGFKLRDGALDMWDANGNKTVHLDGDGQENILVGTLQTALSGDRIVISPRFAQASGTIMRTGSGISFPLAGTYAQAPYIATESNDSQFGAVSTITINGGMRTDGSAGAGTGFGSFMRIGQTRNQSTGTEMASVHMTANCDYMRKSPDTSRRQWYSTFDLSQTSGDGSSGNIEVHKPNAWAGMLVRADDQQNNGAAWVRLAASADNKKPVGILANSGTGVLHLGGYLGGMDGRATFAVSWSESSSNSLKEYSSVIHTFGVTPPAYGRYKSMVNLDSDKSGCYWSVSTCNEKSGSFQVLVRAMPKRVMVSSTQYCTLFAESGTVRYNLVTLSYLISS